MQKVLFDVAHDMTVLKHLQWKELEKLVNRKDAFVACSRCSNREAVQSNQKGNQKKQQGGGVGGKSKGM